MSSSQVPFERLTDCHLRQLGQILWSWSFCGSCVNGGRCIDDDCPWQRRTRLKPFFEHFKDVVLSYGPEVNHSTSLSTVEHIFDVMRLLKQNPHATRAQITLERFNNLPEDTSLTAPDRTRIVNLAVKIMTMISCQAEYQPTVLIEQGSHRHPWRTDASFVSFITDSFPQTDHPSLDGGDLKATTKLKSAISAVNLRKRLGMKFCPTTDLREHLKLDRDRNTLYIYHFTAFIKESLRLSKDMSPNAAVSD